MRCETNVWAIAWRHENTRALEVKMNFVRDFLLDGKSADEVEELWSIFAK